MASKRDKVTLDDFPDSLLSFIFTKIPLKEAIRCSLVCKRWKFLWMSVDELKFSEDFFASPYIRHKCQNMVDQIFKLHSGPLELFEFINVEHCCSRDKICEWVRRAAMKDVRKILIEQKGSRFEASKSIFSCHRLTSLVLKNLLLIDIPLCFGGFANLNTLEFYNMKVGDKPIELIVQLCPILEILTLRNCYALNDELGTLKICSNSLISVEVLYADFDVIKVNCPLLISFTIDMALLDIEESEFYLPECLNLCIDAHLERFTAFKKVKKIAFLNGIEFERNVMILREFPNLEQLCINKADSISKMYRLGGVEEILAVESIKQIHLKISAFGDPTPLLTCLFNLAPAMKTLLIFRKKGFDGVHALRYVNRLLNFRPTSLETQIILLRNRFQEARCFNCHLDNLISD